MTRRVLFCGAIEGSVVVRPGETPAEAIDRANVALLKILDRHARRFAREVSKDDRADFTRYQGPIVGLEPYE